MRKLIAFTGVLSVLSVADVMLIMPTGKAVVYWEADQVHYKKCHSGNGRHCAGDGKSRKSVSSGDYLNSLYAFVRHDARLPHQSNLVVAAQRLEQVKRWEAEGHADNSAKISEEISSLKTAINQMEKAHRRYYQYLAEDNDQTFDMNIHAADFEVMRYSFEKVFIDSVAVYRQFNGLSMDQVGRWHYHVFTVDRNRLKQMCDTHWTPQIRILGPVGVGPSRTERWIPNQYEFNFSFYSYYHDLLKEAQVTCKFNHVL